VLPLCDDTHVRRSHVGHTVALVLLAMAFSFSAAAADVQQLAWLSGCWKSEEGNRRSTEQWMNPAGDQMLGMSHTVVGTKTREFEFMRIVQEENSDIFFVAKPSGQKETRFKLTFVSDGEVRFENPEHDFPQRVIYRRDGDQLVGRVEGTSGGKERMIEFPMRRISCDEPR
jgi:hypothetical protein